MRNRIAMHPISNPYATKYIALCIFEVVILVLPFTKNRNGSLIYHPPRAPPPPELPPPPQLNPQIARAMIETQYKIKRESFFFSRLIPLPFWQQQSLKIAQERNSERCSGQKKAGPFLILPFPWMMLYMSHY